MPYFNMFLHSVRSVLSLKQEGGLWTILKEIHLPKRALLRIFGSFSLLILESFTNVATPWSFSRLVAYLSGKISIEGEGFYQEFSVSLIGLLILYAIISLLGGVLGAVRDMMIAPLKSSLKKQLALIGLEHLLSLDSEFHVNRQIGSLTRIIDRGSDSIGTMLDLILSNIIPHIITLILTFLIIFHIFNYKYILLLIIVISIYSIVSLYFTKSRMKARREKNRLNNEVHHQLVDMITNIETVKIFGNEKYELNKYNNIRDLYNNSEIKLQYFVSSSQIVRGSIIALTTSIFLSLASYDILYHHLSVASFVLLGGYLRNIYSSVASLNYVSAGWRNAHIDIENFVELLRTKKSIKEKEKIHLKQEELEKIKSFPEIIFSNIYFSYGDEKNAEKKMILKNINFKISPGKVFAIIGKTGSGKSTLLKLLNRDYKPSKGNITLNGISIETMEEDDFREMMGIVPQDMSLFNTTIKENIAYGRLSASFEEIIEAAKRAKIDDFIQSLPNGYDTRVGERGLKLSGGERQRIAIARIFLRAPSLLIFDEASSALDTRTEALIQKELKEFFKTRTTIIVAHRLSTICDADHILVLEDGEIKEEGQHLFLCQKGGIYAKMWEAQSKYFGDESFKWKGM